MDLAATREEVEDRLEKAFDRLYDQLDRGADKKTAYAIQELISVMLDLKLLEALPPPKAANPYGE